MSTAALEHAAAPVEAPAGAFRSPYRPELEGLRAIAILLVAASHLWWGRISGGIDVFLVVSGYLITVTLVLRWVRTGELGAIRYLRSLAGRLIPAAVLVLGTVAVLTLTLLAPMRPSLASDILRETGWAALFGENWYLALATDGYLSDDRLLNPVEHFWALSMQVQFYLLWLVIVAVLAAAIGRGSGPRRRLRIATFAVASVTFASWVWSVIETLHDQPVAYLDTTARIWEFGFGGLLALLGARLVPGRVLGFALGWVGLALIVGLGFVGVFDPWFPGIASLVPVAGTALVLIGANSDARFGAHRLLGSRPAVWLGGLAFGLYLWHWPMISALAITQNRRSFTAVDGITIVLAALILAWVMKHALEQPWQRWGRRSGAAAVVAVALIVALGAANLVASNVVGARAAVPPAALSTAPPSPSSLPSSLSPGVVADAPGVFPDATLLQRAVADSAAWTRLPDGLESVADAATTAYGGEGCVHGIRWATACRRGDADAPHTAVIVGDSVAGSWMPAIVDALGPRWQVVLATEGACPAAAAAAYYDGRTEPAWVDECAAIRADRVAGIMSTSPDLVVMTSSARTLDRLVSGATGDAARTEWQRATEEAIRQLAPADTRVVMIAPPPLGVASCGTADFDSGGSRCVSPISDGWLEQSTAERAAVAGTDAAYIDTRGWFCTRAGACPWAVDGSVVRVDTHHLTADYSARLAAVMRAALVRAVPGLPDVGARS